MLRQTLFLAVAALLAALATSSKAQAYGAYSPAYSRGAGYINPAGRPSPTSYYGGYPYGGYPYGVYRRW